MIVAHIFRVIAGAAVLIVLVSCANAPPPTATAASLVNSAPTAGAASAASPGSGPVAETAAQPRAEYIDSDGVFLAPRAPAKPVKKAANAPNGQGLKFRDAPIKTVLDAVLGEMAGASYVIDPAVTGNITFETSGPLDPEAVVLALEDALKARNFALIAAEDGYHVVPLQRAPRMATIRPQPLSASASTPGFGIYVLSPKHIAPSQLQKVLEPFAPTGSVLRVDDQHNMLVLAGTGEELQLLLQTSETFDVDWVKGMSMAFFTVRYVDAEQLVTDINKILEQSGDLSANTLRLIPLARINKILGLSPNSAQLHRVEEWLERLDVKDVGSGRKLYVYPVQNGRAEDLARSLTYILTGQNQGQGFGNSGLPGSSSSPFGGAYGPDSAGGVPSTSPRTTPRPPGAGGGNEAGLSAFRILPSPETNSLLILATPSEYTLVESAMKDLDTPPRQVLIEASLAEVTLTNTLRFGLQWTVESGSNQITFSTAGNGAIASQFPGLSYLYSGTADAKAVLNALEGITKVNVISSPKIMVLNNQSATLQVGDEIPVPTQTAVSVQSDTAPIVNTIQYRSTGVILTVKPRINDSGMVFLDIAQEVSNSAANTSSGIDAPAINQRKVTSTVAVRSGQTIALGGLIRDELNNTKTGLPLLQRIPVLGNLFTDRSDTVVKTELIVFITPRVLRNSDDVQSTMQYLQGEFKRIFPASVPGPDDKGTAPKPH